jgi:tetratricopeptide (TPR) repeat protein
VYYSEILVPNFSLIVQIIRQILDNNQTVQYPLPYLTVSNHEIVMPKRHFIVPFDQNERFTGRKSELDELEKMLFTGARTTQVAVFGLGGVGKTSLTIELVYRIKKQYEDCSIFWIPATNFESLQQAHLNICQKLQLPGWDNHCEDPKRLLQSYLSQASAGQWLLVFDDADDINLWTKSQGSDPGSARLMDRIPKSPDGRILFTTRDRKVAYDLVQREKNIVEVPELIEDVAKALLQKYIPGHELDKHLDDTKSLLRQLTYLPLAIVQAASYINKNRTSLTDYLLLLEDKEEVIELLSKDFEDDSRYRDDGSYFRRKNPVATTWLISFKQIRLRDPLAADYLSFMACVDSKNVPQSLLPPGPSRVMKLEAIGTLEAYSFIQKRAEDSGLATHRLVHLVMRNWLRKEASLVRWTQTAIQRLADLFPDSEHQNRSIWREYLTHALYALNSQLIDQEGEGRIDLAWKVGICLGNDGRWNEAETLLIQVTSFREKVFSKEHSQTLTSMNYLAVLMQSQGRYEAAGPLYKETLQLRKKILGQEHPDTLTSMNNFARLTQSLGEDEVAEPLFKETLRLRKKVLGQEHPDTLASMNNLAVLLQSQGNYEAAELLYKETLQLRKKVLARDHPQTLASMNNFARLLQSQGNYEAAELLHKETLQLRTEVLGQQHPDTLASMNNLAFLLQSQQKYEAAELLYKETLQLRKEVLGQEHPQTLASMHNVARLLQMQGRYKAARPICEETLRLRRKVLGQGHPQTLGTMELASENEFGIFLQGQRQHKPASGQEHNLPF